MDYTRRDANVSAVETTAREAPRTKLALVYAIKDLAGVTQRGILEVYEFEKTRKASLIALYEALIRGGTAG